jgi:hypothetical protein
MNKDPSTLIPLHQHILWPYLLENGFASSANNLTTRNWCMDLDADDTVQIPKQHAVYVFETKGQDIITWYRASNLVTVNNGRLYSVYCEHNHLLGAYAWLTAGIAAEYLTVTNTPLTYKIADGILTLRGMHIDRYTGIPVAVGYGSIATTKCVEVRPKTLWYAKGFEHDLKTVYRRPADQMQLSNKIISIQRWWKKEFKNKTPRKTALWTLCRDLGKFALLGDDLFATIIMLTVSQPRQLRCEFPPINRPEPRQ